MSVHKCTSKSLATCTMVCVQVAFLAFFKPVHLLSPDTEAASISGPFFSFWEGQPSPGRTTRPQGQISQLVPPGQGWCVFCVDGREQNGTFLAEIVFSKAGKPRLMRVSSNGRTPASQAGYAGSNPVVRSRRFERRWEFRVLLSKARGCVLPLVGRGEPTKGTHANVV